MDESGSCNRSSKSKTERLKKKNPGVAMVQNPDQSLTEMLWRDLKRALQEEKPTN